MNCTIIPSKKMCNRCNNIASLEAEHCSSCGVSFVFYKQDAWTSNIPYKQKDKQKCMYDGMEPGTIMGLVCNCPKCTIT